MFISIEKLATFLFALALIHSFCVPVFARWSHRYAKGSIREAFFHLLSEVEIVFGFWAFIFLALWSILQGLDEPLHYVNGLNMTEPLFIFAIMILASSRPLVVLAKTALLSMSEVFNRITKLNINLVQFFILMSLGPLLGSFITEPAAITLVSLLLYRMLRAADEKLLYGTLALLFVNVSVGGGLTHFAAPPILIVAQTWNWGLKDVFVNLGEAVILAVFLNTTLFTFLFKNKIKTQMDPVKEDQNPMPLWIIGCHLFFLVMLVVTAHYAKVFMGLFLVFVGFTTVTKNYQDGLKFREGLLVGFFLAGLIVFGSFQTWWLEPILSSIGQKTMYFVATGLTGITDNAALTYLGSQVPTLTEGMKWALVSGAISGGGLSILANAPNPAGFAILGSKFSGNTLHAGKLLIAALGPTMVVIIAFMLLGNF